MQVCKYQSHSFLTQTQLLSLQNLDAIKICHDDFGEAVFLGILDMTALGPDKVLYRSVACVDDIAQILDMLVFRLNFFQ